VAELDLGEGSTTAGIVDDLLHNTTGVSMTLSVVKGTELGRGLVETGVGRCKEKKITSALQFLGLSLVHFLESIGVFLVAFVPRDEKNRARMEILMRSHSLKMEPRPFLWLRITRPMATV